MEQIVVKHRDNTLLLLNSRANISGITKAEQKIGLLSDDLTGITVESATPLTFELGDTIDVFGKTYTLNFLPTIKKTGKRKFSYELTFEGPQYELLDVQFLLPDDTTGDSFTGNLKDFLEVLLQNIRRIFPGKWALGEYPADTEYKTLSYVGENCLSVLQNLCKEHNIEFEIEQTNGVKTLHIRKAGVNFPYTFRYGRTGGLYELTRKNINSKNVVTRLYVYGGSNNLGSKYRYSKLCLPGKTKNKSYIENVAAIATFGVKENTKTFDEIFPNRYGKVTGKGTKYYAFVDSTMNFDLNEKDSEGTKWLIEGVNAKVKFTTGNLAGYEFDVHKYDHATKTIELVPFTDENGMKFPSETSAAFQFQAEDVYFFTDINLPDSYKTDAEIQLSTAGTEYYNQNCQPQAEYGLNIDQNFIKQFAGELTVVNLFAVGDYILVEDTDIGVNKSIRITGFTRDLLKPYKYSLTLGDSVTQSTYTRIISDLKEIDRVIEINDLADPAKARRNWKASQEVLAMIFDPEGDYYSDKIKPGSIETLMLSVGAKSMQFMLQNTLIEANYQGNKNSIKVTGGVLTHYTISDKILIWNLTTATTTLASDSTAYYIYAKCQKAGSAGSIIFSTTQITVDQDPNYYHFWVGVVNSVVDEVRAVSLTYGATTINGKFIKTGRIESANGISYFDLDNSEIGGKITFKSGSNGLPNIAEWNSAAQDIEESQASANEANRKAEEAQQSANIAQEDIYNMQIGGRNYLPNSDVTISTDDPDTEAVAHFVFSKDPAENLKILNSFRGKYLTVSVDADITAVDTSKGHWSFTCWCYLDEAQTRPVSISTDVHKKSYKGRISYTQLIPDEKIKSMEYMVMLIQKGYTGSLSKPKIEIGTKPTDWTPSPEDTQNRISDLDYLKQVFNRGTTEIDGGVVLSNFMGVKGRSSTDVTGGMIGEVRDDATPLLFSGASGSGNLPDRAKNATFSVCPNGSGRWGIFNIDEKSIQIRDKQNNIKVLFINEPIKTVDNGQGTVYSENETTGISSSNEIRYDNPHYKENKNEVIDVCSITLSEGYYNLDVSMFASLNVSLRQPELYSGNGDIDVNADFFIEIGTRVISFGNIYAESIMEEDTLDTENSAVKQITETIILDEKEPFTVKLKYRYYRNQNLYLSADFYVKSASNLSLTRAGYAPILKAIKTENKMVIGSDGILIKYDSENYFEVKKTDTGRIAIKATFPNSENAESGEIYKAGNMLMIKP